MKIKYIYVFLVVIFCQNSFAQDFTMKNQNKVMGTINPSFYVFGDS